jgi:hypothetical protein
MADEGSQHTGALSRCPATPRNIHVRKNVKHAARILTPVVIALTLVVTAPPSAAQPVADGAASISKPKPADKPRLSREAQAAHSSKARDTRGAMPSLYRGRYYHADQERFRLCVAEREGEFIYTVTGGGGGQYQTTYQFHERNWRRGLTYMMASESRRTHDGLRAEARALVNKPMRSWGRYWIDRAFYTALNYNGKWSGKGHWSGGRWRC